MAKFKTSLYCFICVLVNICCAGESILYLDFMLSVTTVGQYETKNVTIRCSVRDIQQESKDLCDFNISGIIITKYHENDWNPIARICETGQFAESLSGHPDIKGLISDHKSSYLEIQWLNAGPEVFGHYKCVANYQKKSSVRDVLSSKATLDNVITWNPIQVVEKEFDVFFNMCTVNKSSILKNQLTNKPGTQKKSISQSQIGNNYTYATYQIITDLKHLEGDVTLKTWFKHNKSERLSNSGNYFTRKADLLKQHFESQLETLKVNFRTFYQDECSESFRDWQPAVESIENFIIDLKNRILNDLLNINETVQNYILLHSNNQESVRNFCFSLDEKISTQQNISNSKISELSANVSRNQQDINSTISSVIQNNALQANIINDQLSKIEDIMKENNNTFLMTNLLTKAIDQMNQSLLKDKNEHYNRLQKLNNTISEMTKVNREKFEQLDRKMIQYFEKVNNIEKIIKRLENNENHQKYKISEIQNKHTQYVFRLDQKFEDNFSTLSKSINKINQVFESIDLKFNQTSIDQKVLRQNYSSDIIELKEKSNSLNESLNSFRSTYLNLEKSLKQWQADVVEQMKNVSGLISDFRLNTLAIEKINKTLKYLTIDKRLEEWPEGQFSLLKPKSGCPKSSKHGWWMWRDGYRRYQTEINNGDIYSPNIHLQPPIKTKINRNSFFTLTFCVKTFSKSILSWPNGTYCINRKGGSCPGGFQSGYVVINEEGIQTVSKWGGEETDDIKTNVLHFCCRNDSSPLTPILLPRSSPFYLYRYGLTCQQVNGMRVVEEYIFMDTDDENKYKGEGGKHPVLNLPTVDIYLCYYEYQSFEV